MRSALLLFSVGVCSALLLPRTAPVGQRTTVRMSASGSTADYLASTIGPRAAVRLAEGDDAIAGLQAEFEEAAAAGAAALEEAAEALEDAALRSVQVGGKPDPDGWVQLVPARRRSD